MESFAEEENKLNTSIFEASLPYVKMKTSLTGEGLAPGKAN